LRFAVCGGGSRFQDVEPTLLPNPQSKNLWVNQVMPVESPSYWVMGVAVAVRGDRMGVLGPLVVGRWSPPALALAAFPGPIS
jgi:hypothetical protein